jgi:uncharacterized protein involved in exopolysaccharide biosynthesis
MRESGELNSTSVPPPLIAKRRRSLGVVVAASVLVFAGVFILSVLISVLIAFRQPGTYMSSVRVMALQERRPSVGAFEQQNAIDSDPFFLKTQEAIIRSQKVLSSVVERLKLQDQWGHSGQRLPLEDTLRVLRRQLAVRRYRDTSLIEIAVSGKDPKLAADIANTIADVFERDRLEVKREQMQKGINKLREEMVQQQERLKTAQEKVEQVRKVLNVPAFDVAQLTDLIGQLKQQIDMAKDELTSREARWRQLQDLVTPQRLRDAVATVVTEPPDLILLENSHSSELRAEMLQLQSKADDPQLRAAITERDKLREQLDTRLADIRHAAEIGYRLAQACVTALQEHADSLNSDLEKLNDPALLPYRNAQREVELEQRTLAALKTRIQQSSIELQVPHAPVEIIDRAIPSHVPLLPNLAGSLAHGALIGLLVGGALSFLTALGLWRRS